MSQGLQFWPFSLFLGFPGGSVVENLPASAGNTGLVPGWEDPLERVMATHSSILVWESPQTEEPGGLQPMWLQRVRHDCETKHAHSETTLPGANQLTDKAG